MKRALGLDDETQRFIPGFALKPGEPRLTTLAIRPLEQRDTDDPRDRYAVLAVVENVEYVVWTVSDGATVDGTYVRFGDEHGRVFAYDLERLFLRALGDWLCRR